MAAGRADGRGAARRGRRPAPHRHRRRARGGRAVRAVRAARRACGPAACTSTTATTIRRPRRAPGGGAAQLARPVLALRDDAGEEGAAGAAAGARRHADVPGLRRACDVPGLECSPGTCVLHDHGYGTRFRDMAGFVPAAAAADARHQPADADAADVRPGLQGGRQRSAGGQARCILLDVPEYEHGAAERGAPRHRDAARRSATSRATSSYAIPTHICPTCALHQQALRRRERRRRRERGRSPARDRRLTI